jgi:hypothetical protein
MSASSLACVPLLLQLCGLRVFLFGHSVYMLRSVLTGAEHLDHHRLEGWVAAADPVANPPDMQMVSLTLRVMSRPDVNHLSEIYQNLGLE